MKYRTKRKKMRYKGILQIDRLIVNKASDTKNSLVLIWGCKKSMLKKAWFEKEFTPYPYFIVYDFETILAYFNEHATRIYHDIHPYTRFYS